MEFDADLYDDQSYVMYCATEEEAKSFTNHLDMLGRRWHSGDRYADATHFYGYGYPETGVYYLFNIGLHGTTRHEHYKVLNYADFIWEGDGGKDVIPTEEETALITSFLSVFSK